MDFLSPSMNHLNGKRRHLSCGSFPQIDLRLPANRSVFFDIGNMLVEIRSLFERENDNNVNKASIVLREGYSTASQNVESE